MKRRGICPDCGGPMYRYATTCNGCKAKGERNSRFGATLSAETREKISASRRGRTFGPRKPVGEHKNGHGFAQRWFALPMLCERCGVDPPRDRHHIDGNPSNNARANIAFLCRRCHQQVDGRVEILRENGRRA